MRRNKRSGLLESAMEISNTTTNRIGKQLSRSLHFAGASCIGNLFVGMGKLALGILSLSFFTCVSAFYTFGMVVAKLCALTGIVKEENTSKQYRYYRMSGIVLIISSLFYILYSIRLFFYPVTSEYHMYVALAIAAFTFTEITINIRGVIKWRHDSTPLVYAIKMINLASSLLCLVLTQTAILSFTEPDKESVIWNNAFVGVIMGSVATMLGIVMILRMRRAEKRINGGPEND